MNWLDIVLIAVLALSTFQSFRKGFSREIIGLVAAVLALVLGMWFYGLAGSFVAPWVASTRIANLFGFILVVVGVLLCGSLISWIAGRFLSTVGLSLFDRLLGGLFGLARGLVVSIALLTAFIAFGGHAGTEDTPSAVIHSKIAPWLLEVSRVTVAIAPMDLKQSFRKYYFRVRSAVMASAPAGEEKEIPVLK